MDRKDPSLGKTNSPSQNAEEVTQIMKGIGLNIARKDSEVKFLHLVKLGGTKDSWS